MINASVLKRVIEEVREEMSFALFTCGDKVVYIAQFGLPGLKKPGDQIEGHVVSVFNNCGKPTYRVELDLVWDERAGVLAGRNVVVGNVPECSLFI